MTLDKHKDRNNAIISLYRKGMSYDQVAAVKGITRGAVAGVISRYQRKWGKIRRNMRRAGD